MMWCLFSAQVVYLQICPSSHASTEHLVDGVQRAPAVGWVALAGNQVEPHGLPAPFIAFTDEFGPARPPCFVRLSIAHPQQLVQLSGLDRLTGIRNQGMQEVRKQRREI